MKRTRLLLLLVAAVLGCEDSRTGPEALCIAVVNVAGVSFTSGSAGPFDPTSVSTEPYLAGTRRTGCLDQGQTSDPLGHGESNFLPVGTELHTMAGFQAMERLAWWNDTLGEWSILTPLA